MRMWNTVGVLLIWLVCGSVHAMDWNFENLEGKEDPPATAADWQDLHKAAADYVKRHGKDGKAFERYVRGRVETRVEDTGCDEASAYTNIVYDWLVDNRQALEDKEPDAILTVCRHICRLFSQRIPLPAIVRKHATRPLIRKFITFLKEETP